MLNTVISGGVAAGQNSETRQAGEGARSEKILQWRVNERMGGKVPVWTTRTSARAEITDNLNTADAGKNGETFAQALAYAESGQRESAAAEPFGFGDLIDMVNPLQHIPLVSNLYRNVTGDDIRPIARIVGGGIFGGPVGAAAGLVNTVAEYETGRDLAGNVTALVLNGEKPAYRSARLADGPAQQLGEAAASIENGGSALPGPMIGFVDLGYGERAVYERVPASGGRTAGSSIVKRTQISAPDPARTPITQLKLDPLPLLLREEIKE